MADCHILDCIYVNILYVHVSKSYMFVLHLQTNIVFVIALSFSKTFKREGLFTFREIFACVTMFFYGNSAHNARQNSVKYCCNQVKMDRFELYTHWRVRKCINHVCRANCYKVTKDFVVANAKFIDNYGRLGTKVKEICF